MNRQWRSNWRTVVVSAALVLGLSVGSTRAQETLADSSMRRAPTPAEQAASVRAVMQRASSVTQRISQMLQEARRDADIIRVTCLNDKMSQANAHLRTTQARSTAFENATTPEQRSHESTVVGVLGQKFQVLEQEANRCVGHDLYEVGATRVETEIDTAQLPFEEDPVTPVAPPTTIIVPDLPAFASGTK